MPKASAKVMLSHDYCHFEVCLSSDQEMTLQEVNELRKGAQRLADEAVRQYKIAKEVAQKRIRMLGERQQMYAEVKQYEGLPESEWPERIKAINKTLQDVEYWEKGAYDYEDDYEDNGEPNF